MTWRASAGNGALTMLLGTSDEVGRTTLTGQDLFLDVITAFRDLKPTGATHWASGRGLATQWLALFLTPRVRASQRSSSPNESGVTEVQACVPVKRPPNRLYLPQPCVNLVPTDERLAHHSPVSTYSVSRSRSGAPGCVWVAGGLRVIDQVDARTPDALSNQCAPHAT